MITQKHKRRMCLLALNLIIGSIAGSVCGIDYSAVIEQERKPQILSAFNLKENKNNVVIQSNAKTNPLSDFLKDIEGFYNESLKKKQKKEEEQNKVHLGEFRITFYSNDEHCQEQWVGYTATGNNPVAWHTIAVDPKVIPLGSTVYIDGFGTFKADDTGGAIKGKKIDLLVESYDKAIELGVKRRNVYVIS